VIGITAKDRPIWQSLPARHACKIPKMFRISAAFSRL